MRQVAYGKPFLIGDFQYVFVFKKIPPEIPSSGATSSELQAEAHALWIETAAKAGVDLSSFNADASRTNLMGKKHRTEHCSRTGEIFESAVAQHAGPNR